MFQILQAIPSITTFDVFRLLWKCYDNKYTNERRNAKLPDGSQATARDMHVKILLPDFMEYVRQTYGFSVPEECGLKINNVGYALQVTKATKEVFFIRIVQFLRIKFS